MTARLPPPQKYLEIYCLAEIKNPYFTDSQSFME